MKYVWFIQDWNSMEVDCVYTTKKAAVAKLKESYGKGRFKNMDESGGSYWLPDDKANPACYLWRVPLIRAKRKPL